MNCLLDFGFTPTSAPGLTFRTEPAFPLREIDISFVVVLLRRHMIDALTAAHADVAFDIADGPFAVGKVLRPDNHAGRGKAHHNFILYAHKRNLALAC